MPRWLRRVVSVVLTWAVALVLLFEEWGWEPLANLIGQLGRLPLFAWLERAIAQLPPYPALTVFAVPVLALFPIKLLALFWLGQGHHLLGVALIVGAKVLGTAVVARLFQLTKASLMTLRWFAALYTRWTGWKAAAMTAVRASAAWRTARRLRWQTKMRLRRFWAALRSH
jgi:hypothetical protein